MEPKTIDTSKYTRSGKVNVDGKDWTVVLPGAGRELEYSKVQRRVKFLTQKVDAGTANEDDLDKLDILEDKLLDYFRSLFQDGTKDNSDVVKWVNDTPTAIIMAAFEDIKKAAEKKDGEL